MTKAELVDKLARKTKDFSKREIDAIVNTFFDCIKDALPPVTKLNCEGSAFSNCAPEKDAMAGTLKLELL